MTEAKIGLGSLFESADGDEKIDLDSESSDSSDGEGSSGSNSSSSEAESDGVVGENTYSKKKGKDKKSPPPAKSPTKPSTAQTSYEEQLMYNCGLKHAIRIFRTTKEKAKMDVPEDTDPNQNHINFFCVKDVYKNLGLANPRITGKEFSSAKRHFKCKSTEEKRICLPSWLIENVLSGVKKAPDHKNKTKIRNLFESAPVPFVLLDSAPGAKRKLQDAENPKAKKPKRSDSKKGSRNKNNSQMDQDQEFEILYGMLPFAFKLMPPDDKRDVCSTLRVTSCYSSFQLRNASIGITRFDSYHIEDYDGSWENLNESSCGHGTYSFSTLYPFFHSELIVLNRFSFDIPSGAIVTGIRQYWIVRESPDAVPRIHESEVTLIKNASMHNSTIFFANMSTFESQDGWQTFGTTIEYPLAGNDLLWNTTWTPSEINSDLFGVGLRVINPSGANVFARISCMYMEVEFLVASSEISSEEPSSELSSNSSGVRFSSTAIATTFDSSSPISTHSKSTLKSTVVIEYSGESPKMNNTATLIIVSCCLGCLFLVALLGKVTDTMLRKRKLNRKADLLIPFETDELFLKNVEILEKIGEGNFGEVYKGKMNETMPVACKILKNETLLNNFDQNREASILSKLNHENILRFYGIHNANAHMYLITEFIPMGSLHDFLTKKMLSDISNVDKLTLILTIARGMHYLQIEGIIHGDLRTQNLLITKIDGMFSIKISDFGLAKHINQFFIQEDEKFIPIKWTAPEAVTKKAFSNYTDIWSFGVVIWEISHEGELPYTNIKNKDLITELMGGFRLKLKDQDIVKQLRKLVQDCWNIVPWERPEFIEAYREIESKIKKLPSTELNMKIYAPLPLFNKSGDQEVYNNK